MRRCPVVLTSSLLALSLAFASGACNSARVAETPAAAATTPAPTAAAGPPIVDQGTFLITYQGAPVGKETFTIRRDRESITMDHDYDMTVGGNRLAGKGTLVTGLDWKPRSGSWTSTNGADQRTETLTSPPLSLEVDAKGTKKTQADKKTSELVFARTVNVHMTAVCALAADVKSRMVFPGINMTLGAPVTTGEVVRHPVSLGNVAIDVFCQGEKLLGVEVLVQGFAAVREGAGDKVAAAHRPGRTKPALPDGLVELPRKVEVPAADGVEPTTLDCSLLVPSTHAAVTARKGKGVPKALPAVVLVQGNGLLDRDEDTYLPGGVKMAFFKTLAIELGKAGVASLRCDSRGGALGKVDNITNDTLFFDGRAALAALRAEPAIDPARLAVVGHGAGAVVTPRLAIAEGKVRAAVVLAPDGGAADVVPASATGLRGFPVLLSQGGDDMEVLPGEVEGVRAAFAKAGSRLAYKQYPGLNHRFAKTAEDDAQYLDPAAVIDAGFLGDVVAFVTKQL